MANDTATTRPAKAASAAKAKAAKTTRAASGTRSTTAVRAKKTAAGKANAAGKATKRSTATADRAGSRGTTVLAGDYAERAILIPVGIALSARDRVLSGVNEVISSYSSPAKAQTQLRKFERRGNTARNRLEREVRKTRTRIERELRERRRELDRRRDDVAKSFSTQVDQTQSQIESAVRARLEDGADLANRVQERVLSLV
ncbi:MAG TPA: hypothetical protein VGL57_00240 [Solirubrobacteraceae bacterium]|jgi:hypothetical protein